MQCPKCGRMLDENGRCAFCDAAENPEAEDKVRVMTPEEKIQYHGVTIDEEKTEAQNDIKFERSSGWGHRTVFHQVHLGDVSWTSRIAVLLILTAIVLFVVFIALPVAVIGLVVGAVVWALLSFLRG